MSPHGWYAAVSMKPALNNTSTHVVVVVVVAVPTSMMQGELASGGGSCDGEGAKFCSGGGLEQSAGAQGQPLMNMVAGSGFLNFDSQSGVNVTVNFLINVSALRLPGTKLKKKKKMVTLVMD